MPTATSVRHSSAGEFAARAAAWSLALFAVLRLGWVEAQVVLPATQLQARLAVDLLGAPAAPVSATLACSGTDALALCLAAIVAYPATWRFRVTGAAGGIALLLLLNTLRIGTLGRAAASPQWFETLHLFVWPTILTFAIAGYVFWWMRASDAQPRDTAASEWQPTRRFIVLTLVFLLMFVASAPLYLHSALVLALAGVVAQSAAILLNSIGAVSAVTGNVLSTPGGHFLVTQECITTPLIPLYLAAVCTYASSRRLMIAGIVLAVPLFTALGVARLLLVALPASAGSPLFFVHVFYQLALALTLIGIAAALRHDRRSAWRYAAAGIALAIAFTYLAAPWYARLASYNYLQVDDPQGAIAFLPVFQAGLYLAFAVAACSQVKSSYLLAGFVILAVTQLAGVIVLRTLADNGLSPSVREIRGWAVLAPLLIVAVISHVAQPRR